MPGRRSAPDVPGKRAAPDEPTPETPGRRAAPTAERTSGRRAASDVPAQGHSQASGRRAAPEPGQAERSPLDAALSGRRAISDHIGSDEGGRRRAAEDEPGFDLANLGWRQTDEESWAPGRRAARRAREEAGPRDWAADARAADPADSPPPGRGWTWNTEPGGRHRSSGWAPADVDGA
ncbi:hypothetical protein ACFPM7_10165 [Actinokineospora guangxiensis]|uniref:Uncharacterized protein n=1 Tax=Actinokineospora guangxiensis TaxID=1490288 RepID=A0ABW0EN95_9PSEU